MNHYDVIVIGGGQAGLAIGYHLAQQGCRFTILEAADGPAAAWRGRWDSLRLFTPVRHDSLPGLAFPGDADHYPTRDEVVAYLTEYARRFDLPVEYDSPVRGVRRDGDGYLVTLDDRTATADQVVVATGPFQTPRTPPLAEQLDPAVVQMHSSAYRSPEQIPAGPVLVVGGGNTGYQIAEELSATHAVHLSIGARQTPLPQRPFGRDIFSYLVATGLMKKTRDSRLGRRLRDRETLIGSSPRAARRRGIDLHGPDDRRRRSQRQFHRRHEPRDRHRHLGDRLRPGPRLDRRADLRRQRRRRARPRRHPLPRPLLPRPPLAAHPRLGTPGLGQRRRCSPRDPHHQLRESSRIGDGLKPLTMVKMVIESSKTISGIENRKCAPSCS